MHSPSICIRLALAALPVLLATAAPGATLVFGVASGDWNNAANWGGAIPGAGDVAVVNNNRQAIVSSAVAPAPDIIRIGNNSAGGTLTVTGGALSGGAFQAATAAAATGHLALSGGSLDVSGSSFLSATGSVAGTHSTLTVSGGAFNWGTGLTMGTTGTTAVTVSGAAATLGGTNLTAGAGATFTFVLGASGVSAFTGGGTLTIAEGASLVVDGAAFTGPAGILPLFQFGAVSGGFGDNVTFLNFGTVTPRLSIDGGVIYLVTGHDSDWFESVFPPFGEWSADSMPLSISRAYDPSGSSWWVSFDESVVYSHALKRDPSADPHWEMRVGKGGQIYSLRAYGKEWIPPQYRSPAGAYGPDNAPWVDEVFQTVAVSRTLNVDPNPYFLHGAGIYLRDPPWTDDKPFYSPMVATAHDAGQRRLSMVNWSQHAHVPTIHRSGLLVYKQIIDRGQGIIELNWVLHNSGEDLLDFFNLPWGGVRWTSLPLHHIYRSDGTRDAVAGDWSEGNLVNIAQTAGWVGYSASEQGDAPTLGIVFGQTSLSAFDGRWRETRWRWGTAGVWPDPPVPENEWRNYFVGATQVSVNLWPGESLHYRLFMVVGREQDVAARIQSFGLVAAASGQKLQFAAATAPAVPLYAQADGGSLVPAHEALAGQSPWFHLSAVPVPGWRPLFLLRDADGGAILSDDPYRMAHPAGPPGDGYWRPYNGATANWQLLGFAAPAAEGFQIPGEWTSHSLQDLFDGSAYIELALTQELFAGLPPQAGASLSIAPGSAGPELQAFTPVGLARQLQESDDLADWIPASGWKWGTGTIETWPMDPPPAPGEARFFRVLLSPELPDPQP